MTTETSRPTAEIYQFPTRVRKPADSFRQNAASAIDAMTPHLSVAVGGGWYHDAAIQETKRSRER